MPRRTDLETILDHRQRADRHRAGLRVRLLGHAGLPRAARRGLSGRARQLEPGDDHDRPGVRRRAPTSSRWTSRCSPRSSSASVPMPCCPRSAVRPRSTSRWSWRERGIVGDVRRRADRGERRGDRDCRGSRALQAGDDRDRPRGAGVGDREVARRSDGGRRAHRPSGHRATGLHPRWTRHRHRRHHRRVLAPSRPPVSTPARSARSSSSARSPAGRSSSSR